MRCSIEKNFYNKHGLSHGGAPAVIIDNARGYPALSLFESGEAVLTVEFRINCLSRAVGEKLIAKSEVIKCGRTLKIIKREVIIINTNKKKRLCIDATNSNENH